MANFRDICNGRSPVFTSPSSRRKALIWGGIGTIAFIVLIVIIVVATTGSPKGISKGEDALRNFPLIDGHNDLAMNLRQLLKNNITDFNFKNVITHPEWLNCNSCRTDLNRMRAGMVGAQFWSAYVNCSHTDPVQETLEQIDVIRRLVAEYPNDLRLVTTSDDIMNAFQDGRIGSLIGVEGGHAIDSRLGVLRMLYALGARYMTLTHTCNLPWADSCTSESTPVNNLTDFGVSVVHEMNRLGMMVDLSHVSEAVMHITLQESRAPVIFSHSSARALCDVTRNVNDVVLKKLKDNGGIIMVNFYPGFVCNGTNGSANVSIVNVIDHINHIVDVIGVEHVGIGADYDGTSEEPIYLEDVSKYPLLFNLLHQQDSKRWTIENLEKLAGRNLVRVFKKVEEVAAKLSTEKPKQEWISKNYLNETDVCRTKTDVEENIEPSTTTKTITTTSIETSTTNTINETSLPSDDP